MKKLFSILAFMSSISGCVSNNTSNTNPLQTNNNKAVISNDELTSLMAKAKQGDEQSQHLVGLYYYTQAKFAQALPWFEKSANQGNRVSQSLLGTMYRNGNGVTRDIEKAFMWYQKAAEQGDAMGQYYVGLAYFGGLNVKQDRIKGVLLIKKAADQGLPRAQQTLKKLENFIKNK